MSSKLSTLMKAALKSMADSDEFVGSKRTMQSLRKRGLVDESSCLTENGMQTAIALLPLSRQCALLGIEFEEIELPRDSAGPEALAYSYFLKKKYKGICAEGTPILLLIKAAILDFVSEQSSFESREDCCRRYTEAHLQVHIQKASEILRLVAGSKRRVIKRNLIEILKAHESPGISIGLEIRPLLELYELIGPSGLSEVTQIFLEDPYGYRKGWPDLVLWKDNYPRWIEIKTSDKLHASQISTIRRFKGTPAGTFEVAKISYTARRSIFQRITLR